MRELCQGVNIMAFCKEYNAKTADKAGQIIPVAITVYEARVAALPVWRYTASQRSVWLTSALLSISPRTRALAWSSRRRPLASC